MNGLPADKLRARPWSALLPTLLLVVCESAGTSARADSLEFPFLYVGASYTAPDDSRDVKRGTGLESGLGFHLKGNFSLQADVAYTNFNTGAGKGTDFYRSAYDIRANWLLPSAGYRPYGLYVSLGGGIAYNDVANYREDRNGAFSLFALGFFSKPFTVYGWRFRCEYRLTQDSYDHSPLDQEFVVSFVVPFRSK